MKYFALFLLLSFNFSLFAQNWAPINLQDIHHYRLGNSSIITHSIRVEKVDAIGNDSVFHFNRIMIPCDTCSSRLILNGSKCYFLENQPQFLQRRMVKSPGGKYILEDTLQMVLFPERGLHAFWVFDSTLNDTATVTQIMQTPVMGIIDSVKEISLSNGRIILLSKSFGILTFPDWADTTTYQLVGIEGSQQLGGSIPDFHDFYNFQIGDTYQYHGGYGIYDNMGYYKYQFNAKRILISKTVYPDSISFVFQSFHKYTVDTDGFIFEESSTDPYYLTVKNAPDHPANALPNQQYEVVPLSFFVGSPIEIFSACQFREDSTGNLYKFYGQSPTATQHDECTFIMRADSFQDILYSYGSVQDYEEIYEPGLGRTSIRLAYPESIEYEYLTAYIIGGDTTGDIMSDSAFLVSLDPGKSDDIELKIYPNPTTGLISTSWDTPLNANARLVISDLNGRQVFTTNLQPGIRSFQFELSGLSPGMYLLKVDTEKGIAVRKIVVRE